MENKKTVSGEENWFDKMELSVSTENSVKAPCCSIQGISAHTSAQRKKGGQVVGHSLLPSALCCHRCIFIHAVNRTSSQIGLLHFFSLVCQEGEQHPACLAAAVELESRDSPFILHPVTILTSMFIKLGFSGSLAPFVKGWKSESCF